MPLVGAFVRFVPESRARMQCVSAFTGAQRSPDCLGALQSPESAGTNPLSRD
jgi:hypothetical protein